MKGVSEFIKDHENRLTGLKDASDASFDQGFLSFHLKQIGFLQHERLVHLLVMLFVLFAVLLFFILFLLFHDLLVFGVFLLCLVLSIFYVFHYFKLENTVIRWYFIYNRWTAPKP
jgi:Flp pilus assembly protein TadB